MKSSADRTSSSRKRAGSRRNKKLKNVRTFASDGHSRAKRSILANINLLNNSMGRGI